MESFELYLEPLPANVKVSRVHAVLLTPDGRVLVRYKDGTPRKVTGGHIDPDDSDMESALKRELLEEISCKIDRCDYVGYYVYTNEAEQVREIWARMVARVSEILPAQPDPDRAGRWVYGRKLVPISKIDEEKTAPQSLVEPMAQLLEAAVKLATEKGYFTEPKNEHVTVINEEEHIVE